MASSLAQERALALLPKFTGWISVAFSGLVTSTVLRDKTRRSLCYHRLVCGISLVDMSASLWLGMSTWPIPRGGALWAIGNATSCNVQGFFTQFGICSSFYNSSLAMYFYLVIVRGWKEKQLQQIEWMLHTVPLLWALLSAVTGLFLHVFDNATLWCWVSADEVSFRWIAFYGPLWLNIFIVTFSCWSIFLHVRKLELASQKYQLFFLQKSSQQPRVGGAGTENDNPPPTQDGVLTKHSSQPSSNDNDQNGVLSATQQGAGMRDPNAKSCRRSNRIYHQSRRVKDVADQCFLYAFAFYVNWAALTTTRLIQTVNGKVYYPLVLIAAITVPMQGLPNFVVYLRPKLRRVRKRYPHAGWVQWVARSMSRNESRHAANEVGSLRQISVMDGMNPSRINDDLDDNDDYYINIHDVDGNHVDTVDTGEAVAGTTDKGDDSTNKPTAEGKENERMLDNPPDVQN